MKKTLLLILLLSTMSICAQENNNFGGTNFSVELGLGSLKLDGNSGDQWGSRRIINPQLSYGGRFKGGIGLLIIRKDTTLGDPINTDFNPTLFTASFSYKEFLPNSPFYFKGSVLFIPGDPNNSSGSLQTSGNRISGEIGVQSKSHLIDGYITYGRLYDRRNIYNGSILTFGLRVNYH